LSDLTKEQEVSVGNAERAVQKILLELEQEIGMSVDMVDVDTHNFMELRTSIFMKKGTRL
jgi:hypothetical protein